jgi:hypothetical protein
MRKALFHREDFSPCLSMDQIRKSLFQRWEFKQELIRKAYPLTVSAQISCQVYQELFLMSSTTDSGMPVRASFLKELLRNQLSLGWVGAEVLSIAPIVQVLNVCTTKPSSSLCSCYVSLLQWPMK